MTQRQENPAEGEKTKERPQETRKLHKKSQLHKFRNFVANISFMGAKSQKLFQRMESVVKLYVDAYQLISLFLVTELLYRILNGEKWDCVLTLAQ